MIIGQKKSSEKSKFVKKLVCKIGQKISSKKFVKKNRQKNCQNSRNHHQVTLSNTKVTNILDAREKKPKSNLGSQKLHSFGKRTASLKISLKKPTKLRNLGTFHKKQKLSANFPFFVSYFNSSMQKKTRLAYTWMILS